MKNVKEVIRGNNSTSLDFVSNRGTGSITYRDGKFIFSHEVSVPGDGAPSEVLSVFGRNGEIVAAANDYSLFYSEAIHTHTKDEVGLSNVDDTSDLNKVISTATQTALDTKVSNTFIEETLSGDDAGLIITGQLGIGTWDNPLEFVCGQGDSTTEAMSVQHTSDGVSFTDNTVVASSDTDSAFYLFGGNSPKVVTGSTIYIGGDFTFNGVKAKIVSNGLVEPDNIVIEYWNGAWESIGYMATDSNPPLHAVGNQLAQNNHSSEQWRFNFDPYDNMSPWVQSTVNGVVKYWVRIRIVSDITNDVELEQIKLHTSRFEANANGSTEYFGTGRYKKTLLNGVSNLINNTARSAANQNVTYISGEIVADYNDNQFNNNTIDSKVFIINVDEGLDTSIPLEIILSYYVEGTPTGDIEFEISKLPITDGFVYDGSATRTGIYSVVDSVLTNSNLIRRTSTVYVDIQEGLPGTGYLMELSRNATSANPNDTLADSVVMTHIIVNGYYWKP